MMLMYLKTKKLNLSKFQQSLPELIIRVLNSYLQSILFTRMIRVSIISGPMKHRLPPLLRPRLLTHQMQLLTTTSKSCQITSSKLKHWWLIHSLTTLSPKIPKLGSTPAPPQPPTISPGVATVSSSCPFSLALPLYHLTPSCSWWNPSSIPKHLFLKKKFHHQMITIYRYD